MSAIPPNPLASIVQAHGAQERAAVARQREAAQERDRAGVDTFGDRLREVIATEERDAQVFSDAEGSGAGGRSTRGEHEPAQDEDERRGPDAGDDSTGGSIDIQA